MFSSLPAKSSQFQLKVHHLTSCTAFVFASHGHDEPCERARNTGSRCSWDFGKLPASSNPAQFQDSKMKHLWFPVGLQPSRTAAYGPLNWASPGLDLGNAAPCPSSDPGAQCIRAHCAWWRDLWCEWNGHHRPPKWSKNNAKDQADQAESDCRLCRLLNLLITGAECWPHPSCRISLPPLPRTPRLGTHPKKPRGNRTSGQEQFSQAIEPCWVSARFPRTFPPCGRANHPWNRRNPSDVRLRNVRHCQTRRSLGATQSIALFLDKRKWSKMLCYRLLLCPKDVISWIS